VRGPECGDRKRTGDIFSQYRNMSNPASSFNGLVSLSRILTVKILDSGRSFYTPEASQMSIPIHLDQIHQGFSMKYLISFALVSFSLTSLAAPECRLSVTYLDRALISESQREVIESKFSKRGFELISERNLSPGDFILDGVFRMESPSIAMLDSIENSSVIMGQGKVLRIDESGSMNPLKLISYALRKTPQNETRVLSSLAARIPKCSQLLKKVSR